MSDWREKTGVGGVGAAPQAARLGGVKLTHKVNTHVVEDLVGKGALGYHVAQDGTLTIIDRKGRKHFFEAEEYADLLKRDLERARMKTRGKKVRHDGLE